MTVYPFKIPLPFFPHELTGYGLMMMVAFLTGGWLVSLELRRRHLSEDYSADIVAAAVIGGVVGAKLWYVALTRDPGALFSRGGFVWYGGFLGGTAAVILNGWRLRVPLRWTMQLVAPALAAAYALGRVGCFLVNDDYGRPSSLPWAMKFPAGTAAVHGGQHAADVRHPGAGRASIRRPCSPSTRPSSTKWPRCSVAFALLWAWRTRPRPVGWLFGAYLVFAGVERFLVEILRAKDDRLLGPFTLAQLTSVILVGLGAYILTAWRGAPEPAPGTYLSTGKEMVASKTSTAALSR